MKTISFLEFEKNQIRLFLTTNIKYTETRT